MAEPKLIASAASWVPWDLKAMECTFCTAYLRIRWCVVLVVCWGGGGGSSLRLLPLSFMTRPKSGIVSMLRPDASLFARLFLFLGTVETGQRFTALCLVAYRCCFTLQGKQGLVLAILAYFMATSPGSMGVPGTPATQQ